MPDVNDSERLHSIPGSVPSNFNSIEAGAFAFRNQWALDIDFVEHPPFFKISDTHYAATWLLDKRSPKVNTPELILNRWATYKQKWGKIN